MKIEHAPIKYIEDKNGLRWPFGMTDKYRTSHAKCSEEKLCSFLTRRGLVNPAPLQETGRTIMTQEQKYKEVIPCGYLTVNKEVYLLLSPEPVIEQWESGLHRHGLRYLVAPEKGMYASKLHRVVHRCARHIVVFGDHHIEYIPTGTPILVKDLGEDDVLGNCTEVHADEQE